MIDVTLSRIVVRDGADQQYIFLSELDGTRGFPIVIGSNEALEIQRVVHGIQPARPLTHQLTLNSIEALGGKLEAIEIVDLKHNTFFARLLITREGEDPVHVDARPSDAIALALRAQCKIRVAEHVLERATDSKGPS